jgi:Cu+-exporting ATPase
MLLAMAAALENHSEHPLAHAVLKAAQERAMILPEARDFQATSAPALAGRRRVTAAVFAE